MSLFDRGIWLLFAPGVASIGMLALPWPPAVRELFRKALEKTMFLRIWKGRWSLYHVLLGGSASALVAFMLDARWRAMEVADLRGSTAIMRVLPFQWRAERNAWIAAFALTTYVAMDRFHVMSREIDELRGRIKDIKDMAK